MHYHNNNSAQLLMHGFDYYSCKREREGEGEGRKERREREREGEGEGGRNLQYTMYVLSV